MALALYDLVHLLRGSEKPSTLHLDIDSDVTITTELARELVAPLNGLQAEKNATCSGKASAQTQEVDCLLAEPHQHHSRLEVLPNCYEVGQRAEIVLAPARRAASTWTWKCAVIHECIL